MLRGIYTTNWQASLLGPMPSRPQESLAVRSVPNRLLAVCSSPLRALYADNLTRKEVVVSTTCLGVRLLV